MYNLVKLTLLVIRFEPNLLNAFNKKWLSHVITRTKRAWGNFLTTSNCECTLKNNKTPGSAEIPAELITLLDERRKAVL